MGHTSIPQSLYEIRSGLALQSTCSGIARTALPAAPHAGGSGIPALREIRPGLHSGIRETSN
jgi:hypothetical protein